ncbi:basic helix-loop-helix (bHLH) DNA-binding superfamily protein [Zea mays]|uniref:Basic helix-loop-helix (BHLH) DNA-binding superfamily protein n=1 Tax=Zea mays TaxID=4577 RepID=A0A1D6J568_MAIZE|nr:basic helix-loop-helix (bHLH) DNA-binding superfamily protein [Zea mays]
MQMDKASIIKDAIEYIQQLQVEERRVLQELRVLDDDTAAAATAQVECCDVDGGLLRREAERAKKMKRAQSVASGAQSAPPPPPPPHVEVLELRVSEVGDHVLVVSVTCRKRRDAMARVCRAIEDLRLRVITANVTSVAGCHVHTVFVEVDKIDHIQVKNMIEAALTLLDAPGSPHSSMSYYET